MALSIPVDLGLLLFSLLATVLTGLAFRVRHGGPAFLLFLIPPALSAASADLLLRGLQSAGAGFATGHPRGAFWFLFALAWIPAELLNQRAISRLAGAGMVERSGDRGP